MKKNIIFVMMGVALLFTSCKSSQSAYKQAYERAKAQEAAVQAEAPVQQTTVQAEAPVQQPKQTVAPVADAPVRSEQVVAITGDIKAYSVICGSFSVKANAEGLCEQLQSDGYKAGIVKNSDKNMYRVFIGTYNTKDEALAAMAAFKAAYPTREDFQGSWILLKK